MRPIAIGALALLGLSSAAPGASDRLDSAASSCLDSGRHSDLLLTEVRETLSSRDVDAVAFRRARRLREVPAARIRFATDARTCARAVAAFDAEQRRRIAGYSPKPLDGRTLYVIQAGKAYYAVLDTDPGQRFGEFRRLYWFTADFGRLVLATTA